jgi:hypothetical protein
MTVAIEIGADRNESYPTSAASQADFLKDLRDAGLPDSCGHTIPPSNVMEYARQLIRLV